MNLSLQRTLSLIVALALVAATGAFMAVVASAAPVLTPFTQAELDTNWEADRFFPTDGASSTSAFGRSDVARIGIDATETQAGTFQRTEGIKTVGDNNFGTSSNIDLYLDPDWADQAVRAGFWVVGDNGANARDNLFGIIEFVHLEPSTSGASAVGDHEGWRVWDSITGWTNLDVPFTYGEWVTLGIELDTTEEVYRYTINGTEVATSTGGVNFIRELFINSYNYGLDEFPNLENGNYAAHWHVGLEDEPEPELQDPQSFRDCMRGGWEAFGFSNQGRCIQYALTGIDSR